MSDPRGLIERELERVELRTFTLDGFYRRRERKRRNRRIGSAAFALAVAVLAAAGLARAFRNIGHEVPTSPPTGTIVFSRQLSASDGDYLFTIRPDGSQEQALRTGADQFAISPDGSTVLHPDVVFHCSCPTWGLPAVVSLDGSHRRILRDRVPMKALWPSAWSPDGSRFVAEGRDPKGSPATGLYTARSSAAGDLVQITSTPDKRNDEPVLSAWSPDGSKVLFVRQAANHGAGLAVNLFVVNVDGSGLQQLNPAGVVLGPFDKGVGGIPSNVGDDRRAASWSPDGTQVAFAGALGSPQDVRAGEVPRGLFVVNADGAHAHQIASGQIPDAQWSPDGRWIAFTEGDPNRPDVFVVHPDGTGLQRLTSSADGLASWGPIWSSDGSTVLLTRSRSVGPFDSNLWIVSVDGSHLSQVTHEAAEYFSYSWSPASVP